MTGQIMDTDPEDVWRSSLSLWLDGGLLRKSTAVGEAGSYDATRIARQRPAIARPGLPDVAGPRPCLPGAFYDT
jgi:hypothetical protein